MVRSESVFCRLLEIQYNTLDSVIETALYLPIRVLREVKSNFSRVENLIIGEIEEQLDFYENALIEILLLENLATVQGINDFCRIAFSCRALVNILVQNSNTYLDYLSPAVVNQLSANYQVFESNVCNLGLKRIVNNFTAGALQDIIDAVTLLRQSLVDELRIDDMLTKYTEALTNSGIYGYLDQLENYTNCGFAICDFATTSSNRIGEITDKLSLYVSGTSWAPDFDTLLSDYYVKRERLYTRIDDIIDGATNRNYKSVNRGVRLDEIMKF